ncbi:MAG: cyclodeaminase/cyclohydrolase family protein [Desulfobacterales bacterium]|nr:cyclodeaminase/cyclohydrolase family protein [Desulfobacterales bacterium]
MLSNLKITKFLEKTAEGTAVPGGGSIAALNAAISAGLSEMVANLTIGKKGYEAVQKEMKEITAAASKLRKKLVKDIDRDAAAYNEVMKAFKMPQNTEKQQDRRNNAIQAGLKNASLVPLSVARDALSIMDLTARVIRKGNKNAATDGAVAALTARTAILGALYNVKTNLNFIEDHKFLKEMTKEVKSMESRVVQKEKEILSHVDI